MMRGFFVLLVLALAGSHCAVVWAQEYTPQCRNAGTGKLQDCTGRLRRDQAPLVDVQRFTVVGAALWTKPVGSYQLCTTRCCGGGGGGGSGSRRPAPGGGGAGGSGGGCSERQYDPTEAGAVAVLTPEMTATLTLRSGTGITCVANVNLDIQSGDEVETSIWVVDSASVATEIANTRSLTSTVGKVRVPVTTQIAPTEITGPTPHTVQMRWRAITGMARAIATNRRLFAAEF